MKLNYLGIQDKYNSLSVSTKARFLMSERRHQERNREESMLQRAVAEVRFGA